MTTDHCFLLFCRQWTGSKVACCVLDWGNRVGFGEAFEGTNHLAMRPIDMVLTKVIPQKKWTCLSPEKGAFSIFQGIYSMFVFEKVPDLMHLCSNESMGTWLLETCFLRDSHRTKVAEWCQHFADSSSTCCSSIENYWIISAWLRDPQLAASGA